MVIKTLQPLVPRGNGYTIAREPKQTDPYYLKPEHKAWREQVLRKAGHRCERVVDGRRCEKAAPQHRMFANHIKERRDGGADLDPANGECLCGSHHTSFTLSERAKRHRVGGG